jgi:hypothetical protein
MDGGERAADRRRLEDRCASRSGVESTNPVQVGRGVLANRMRRNTLGTL